MATLASSSHVRQYVATDFYPIAFNRDDIISFFKTHSLISIGDSLGLVKRPGSDSIGWVDLVKDDFKIDRLPLNIEQRIVDPKVDG